MSKLGEWLSAESKRVAEDVQGKQAVIEIEEKCETTGPARRPRVIDLTFQGVIGGQRIARYTDSETGADIKCEVKSDSHWQKMIEKAKQNAQQVGCICKLYNSLGDGDWTPLIFDYSK